MSGLPKSPQDYVAAITKSGLSIYDKIEVGSALWIPSPDLEILIEGGLRKYSTGEVAIKTRSKMVKLKVCEILGYPAPKTFKRCKPRFPGQNFDTHVQAADNLQVWNDQLSPARRYVLLRPQPGDDLWHVKVLTGVDLAPLDKTGKLTQKYQARLNLATHETELISAADSSRLLNCVAGKSPKSFAASPVDYPKATTLLPIKEVFARLSRLVGRTFPDAGIHQERNRGGALHKLVSKTLGYPNHRDDGKFPDIRHQLLEVKLQTAQTIDLGLVTPSSEKELDLPQINGVQIRECDVRYAIFYARTDGKTVTLTHLFLTTGVDFFKRFPRFEGKVLNKKSQLHLPRDFFTKAEGLEHQGV